MGNMKKFSAFFLSIFAVAIMFFCQGCPCPKSPDPLIILLNGSGFSVSPGQVLNADSVLIFSADGDSNPLDTIKIAVGQSQEYHYDATAKRPIHLKLSYTNTSGNIILDDFVSVEDVAGNPGTPVISTDVVMGFTATNPPTQVLNCTTPGTIATGYGEVIVSWVPNDWFEVHVSKAAGGEEIIGIRMEASTINAQTAGAAKIYLRNSHICLSTPTCDDTNPKAMKIGSSSPDLFYVTGTDNNDGSTARTLKIKNYASPTVLITVKK